MKFLHYLHVTEVSQPAPHTFPDLQEKKKQLKFLKQINQIDEFSGVGCIFRCSLLSSDSDQAIISAFAHSVLKFTNSETFFFLLV